MSLKKVIAYGVIMMLGLIPLISFSEGVENLSDEVQLKKELKQDNAKKKMRSEKKKIRCAQNRIRSEKKKIRCAQDRIRCAKKKMCCGTNEQRIGQKGKIKGERKGIKGPKKERKNKGNVSQENKVPSAE